VIIMTPKINRRSLGINALVGAGALAASLAVVIPLASHTAHASHPGQAPVAAPAGPSPDPSQVGPTILVPGKDWADGLALGFPDTRSGALSAGLEDATAFIEALDVSRLSTVLRDIGTPGERVVPDLAVVVRNDRALIDAPANGPLPPGAALSLTGRMYQLPYFDQRKACVLLLFTMAAYGPGAPDLSGKALAVSVQLNWAGSDWKLAAWGGGTDRRAPLAPPDSTAAYDDGWTDLPSAADGPGSWS
jgi:hypothetical protein